jgi:glycosyltransferase involved in cell wall biosynthesis
MAASIPVIASPVGSNKTIVRDGETGFLAADDAEWVDRLELLYRDPELRRKMGAAGRTLAAESYSLEVTAPRLARLLRYAAEGRAGTHLRAHP